MCISVYIYVYMYTYIKGKLRPTWGTVQGGSLRLVWRRYVHYMYVYTYIHGVNPMGVRGLPEVNRVHTRTPLSRVNRLTQEVRPLHVCIYVHTRG